MIPEREHESIGQRLRRLRTERGLSQRELAEPGVSYAYISRIEAGTRQPSVKALRKLAAKLGVSPDFLETGSPVRGEEARELRIADAELELRMGEHPAAAEERLHELLGEATASADPAATIRLRIALGFAAAAGGRHHEAVEFLEQVVDEGLVQVTTRPDVFSALGFEYAALGRVEQAVELYERSLAELEVDGHDDPAARIRFSTLLSYALSDLGELDRAREILESALHESQSLTDLYAQIRVNWSLARLESMQNEQGAALRHARKALALLEATEDTLHLARAHHLCGSITRLQGAPERAAEHLGEAERLLGAKPSASDLASLRSEQAKVAADLGYGARAVVLAREALTHLDDDPAERGAATWALARGLALEGDLHGADAAFSEAVDLLGRNGRWRDVELAAEDWAQMLRRAGRDEDADTVSVRFAGAGAAQKTRR